MCEIVQSKYYKSHNSSLISHQRSIAISQKRNKQAGETAHVARLTRVFLFIRCRTQTTAGRADRDAVRADPRHSSRGTQQIRLHHQRSEPPPVRPISFPFLRYCVFLMYTLLLSVL